MWLLHRKSGSPVRSNEVRFAAVEHHGHEIGHEVTDEELDAAPEEEWTITQLVRPKDCDSTMGEV